MPVRKSVRKKENKAGIQFRVLTDLGLKHKSVYIMSVLLAHQSLDTSWGSSLLILWHVAQGTSVVHLSPAPIRALNPRSWSKEPPYTLQPAKANKCQLKKPIHGSKWTPSPPRKMASMWVQQFRFSGVRREALPSISSSGTSNMI